MPFLRLRILVRATGEWEGKTFYIADVRDVTRDLTTEDMESLSVIAPVLSSGTIKEALNVLELGRTGELVDLLRSEKDEVAQKLAEGLDDEKACRLLEELNGLTKDADILDVHNLFRKACTSLDFEHALVAVDRLHRRAARNKISVYELIKNYPWVLGQVFDEDGLVAADIIAKYFGIDYEVNKCRGRIITHLLRDTRQGHAFTPSYHIYAGLKGFTKETVDEAFDVINDPQARKKNGYFIPETKHLTRPLRDDFVKAGYSPADAEKIARSILLPGVFHCEKRAAEILVRIIKENGIAIDTPELQNKMADLAAQQGIGNLDSDQLKIAESLCRNKVTVVTGEAGSGKTTAVKLLVRALQEMLITPVPVLAPTGRAAQIVGAEIGADYSTIHRWARVVENETDLVVDEETGKAEEEKPVVPVLIVDEMSMATVTVFAKMLMACAPVTRLVLLGDPAQLPPIGPGGVFQALIEIAKDKKVKGIELVELKNNYRVTQQDSGVIQNALRIRRGLAVDENLPNVHLVGAKTQKQIIRETAAIVESLLDRGTPWEDIMVLGTTRTRGVSVEELNAELRRKFGGKPIENVGLAPGDPVIATRNDYEDGGIPRGLSPARRKKWMELRAERANRPTVYNGTKGIISGLSEEGDVLKVAYKMPQGNVPAEYKVNEIPYYVELAYATTVHKAQGGQAKYVIFACNTSVSRNMLYTAVTRCKDGEVWLIGPREIWDEAVKKDVSVVRSKLKYRIMEEAGLISEVRPVYPQKGKEFYFESGNNVDDIPKRPEV
jgi:exodeoxyribonuclease V alpha subunit